MLIEIKEISSLHFVQPWKDRGNITFKLQNRLHKYVNVCMTWFVCSLPMKVYIYLRFMLQVIRNMEVFSPFSDSGHVLEGGALVHFDITI